MEDEAPEQAALQRHLVKGSAWTVGIRWSARTLGFISTLFLARLLMPEDFGIVTIAMIVVGTVEVFNQTGQHLAIIRHQNPARAHYDSAWTIFILLSTTLACVVFLAAPLADFYFREPRAVVVIHILALKTFITGFENVGIVDFRRDLKFHRQFIYQVVPSVLSFFVTLTAAFILRNYWALVIGILSEEFCRIVLSYVLSPFRPRISFAKVRELWSFSTWTFVRSIGGYLGNQVDKLAIGGFAGAAAMGRYEIAVDVASSPTQEINNPMISVLFPVMAKAQGDETRLKELYLTVLYWSVLICSSTSVGVALVTSDLVDVVLGPNWVDVKPLMPWLALAYGLMGCSAGVIPALDTVGKPQVSAALQWSMVAAFVVCIVPTAWIAKNVEFVAAARLVFAILIVPAALCLLARCLSVRIADIAAVFWRPAVASVLMALTVWTLQGLLDNGLLRLIFTVVSGAIVYAATLMGIWYAIGCPSGPERVFHDLVFGGIFKKGERKELSGILTSNHAVVHQTKDNS